MDAVAAEHNSADSIIHFGRSCLSRTEKLPVLYVFTRLPIDVKHCAIEVSKLVSAESRLLIVYDLLYHHAAG